MCLFCGLPQTIYCERGLSTALWAEPINALTNLAFPIAGYFGYRLLKETHPQLKHLRWMLSFIGLGSFIYHTWRTPYTLVLDAVPIYTFILTCLFFVLQRIRAHTKLNLLILTAFVGIQILLTVYVPRDFLNGSVRHLVNLGFISLLGYMLINSYGKAIVRSILLVITVYAMAILFRSLDNQLCDLVPFGTHFLWHIFAAIGGYYAIKLLVDIESIPKTKLD